MKAVSVEPTKDHITAPQPLVVTGDVDFSMSTLTTVDASDYEERLAEQRERDRISRAAAAAAPAPTPKPTWSASVSRSRTAPTATKTAAPTVPTPRSSSTAATQVLAAPTVASSSRAVEIGMKYLGVPYRWGGTDPDIGLDCSGFVGLVFRQMGINLPRTSGAIAAATTPISASEARPGDLVFMGSPVHHVGIYMGNGKILDARKAGVPVGVGTIWQDHTQYRRVV
jgi:cell wall-associated NlpC family hydrolase